MRIVFTTPRTLNTFDFDSSALTTIAAGPQEFYGISGDADRLVLSHSCIDPESLKTHQDYLKGPSGILSITGANASARTAPVLMQPHQLEYHEGLTLCADAGRNCLTIVDPQLQARDFYPTTARWDIGPGERKANHFNSVHIAGRLVYMVAHNYQRYSTVWIFEWPKLDLADVLPTRSEWAHNVWVLEDDLIVCNSKAGALYSVTTRADIWTFAGGGYITRGLAANKSYIVVGLSALASRGDRKDSNSGFCVIDRETLKTLDTYIFDGIGAVHEIRLLDEPDLCHSQSVLRLPSMFKPG